MWIVHRQVYQYFINLQTVTKPLAAQKQILAVSFGSQIST